MIAVNAVSVEVTLKRLHIPTILSHVCAFHEEPSLPPFKAKSFTYQMCLVVRFVGAKKKSLIVVLSSVSLKNFQTLYGKRKAQKDPRCASTSAGMTTCEISGGKGKKLREGNKIFPSS